MKYRFFHLLPICLISLALCGCPGAILTPYVMIKGTDIDPPYTFLMKGDKKVAVVCRSMATNQYETMSVPRDLARLVGDLIHNKAKNKKLKVVEATKIDAWLDNCDNVFSDFLEIGRDKTIAADYIIGIELIGYQLRDAHSPHLLQGNARLQVRAFDCETGEVVANETIECTYPPSTPMTAGPGVDQKFRTEFIRVVSEQVAMLFVPRDRYKSKQMDADTLEMHRI